MRVGLKPLHRRTLRKIAADFLGNRARHCRSCGRWADSVRALSGHSGDHLFDRLDARFFAAGSKGATQDLCSGGKRL